jgi:hypothetical protein
VARKADLPGKKNQRPFERKAAGVNATETSIFQLDSVARAKGLAMAAATAAVTTAAATAAAVAAAWATSAAAGTASAAMPATAAVPSMEADAAAKAQAAPEGIAAPIPAWATPAIVIETIVSAAKEELRLLNEVEVGSGLADCSLISDWARLRDRYHRTCRYGRSSESRKKITHLGVSYPLKIPKAGRPEGIFRHMYCKPISSAKSSSHAFGRRFVWMNGR